MMNFLIAPVIVGTVTVGIYKLFQLFVCKNERLALIEKLGHSSLSVDLGDFQPKYTALRGGSLLMGIGLGIAVAFFLIVDLFGLSRGQWESAEMMISAIFGGCLLLFGGLGLIVSFVVEMKLRAKEKR